MTYDEMFKIVDKLSVTECRALNGLLVNKIKVARANENFKKLATIGYGDKVMFNAKRRGTIRGVIEGVNRTTVNVRSEAGTRWKVAISLIQKVG